MYACNGILFNHESPIRGETFVTRKITRGSRASTKDRSDACISATSTRCATGVSARLRRAQWLMLQQEEPEDYVIATGEQHSVREFVELAAAQLGIRSSGAARASTSRVSIAIRQDAGQDRPTLFPAYGSRDLARRLREGQGQARLAPGDVFPVADPRNGRDRPRTGQARLAHAAAKGSRSTTTMNRRRPIFVAGHRGLVGSAIVRELGDRGLRNLLVRAARSWIFATRRLSSAFLRSRGRICVPGGGQGRRHPRQQHISRRFIRDNLLIQTNVIDAAWRTAPGNSVPGLELHLPEAAPQPMREDAC